MSTIKVFLLIHVTSVMLVDIDAHSLSPANKPQHNRPVFLSTVPSYMLSMSKLYERRFMLPTFLSLGIYGGRRGKELWLYQRLMVGVGRGGGECGVSGFWCT